MKINVQGREYWVEDRGYGRPLLLLHGFTGSTHTFDRAIDHMEGDYRFLSVDLPGHGYTGRIGALTMEQFCTDLAELIDEIGVKSVSLLGYSLGGRTALSFAVLYPHLVDRLLLESASPGLMTAKEQLARQAKDEALAEKILNDGLEAFVSYWERIPLFQSQKKLSDDVKAELRKERLSQDVRGLVESLKGMGTGYQPSWWDKLGDIRLSVKLITGEEDKKFGSINEKMAERLPKASWTEVENAGHTVHLEKPKIFAKIVDGFMIK